MPRPRLHSLTCQRCGDPIKGYGARRKYCSVECAQRARLEAAPTVFGNCEQCGKPFTGRKSIKRFCSTKCSRKAVYHRSRKPPGDCRGCGNPLPADARADVRFCSIRCRSAYYEACRKEAGQPSSYRKGWNGYGLCAGGRRSTRVRGDGMTFAAFLLGGVLALLGLAAVGYARRER